MSKIKLTGSNSGYVEIDSAADAGNLTLQLPTSGTKLLSDAGNVFTGITTTGQLDINGSIDVSSTSVFNNDLTLKGGSYDVLWDSSDNSLEFGTNAKATFGDAMQLYHDGSNSLIQDSGTGHVQIRSGTFTVGNAGLTKTSAIFNSGSGQQLNFNNSQKFITTNTGVVITGICTATSFSGSGENLTRTTPLSHRNLVMNGKFEVFQRNLPGSQISVNAGNNFYCMDRWYGRGESSKGVFTFFQQDIQSEGQGAHAAARVQVTTASGTPSTDDVYKIAHRMEGVNVRHLCWGTSGAKTITLSFLVKSSVQGTFGGSIMNSAQNRAYPFTYVISGTGWEQKSITIPGDTGGTWVVGTGIGLELNFDMGTAESNYRRPAGSWYAGRAEGADGTVQLVQTNGANWYVTKVQIEEGSTATPFEHIPYADELARCQRYYYQHARGDNKVVGASVGYQSNDIFLMIYPKVTMRAAPTLVQETGTNYYRAYNNGGYDMFNQWGSTWNIQENMFSLNANSSHGLSSNGGQPQMIITSNSGAYMAFDADL